MSEHPENDDCVTMVEFNEMKQSMETLTNNIQALTNRLQIHPHDNANGSHHEDQDEESEGEAARRARERRRERAAANARRPSFHDVIMVEVLVMDMREVLDWKKVKLKKRMIMMIVVTEEIVGVISTMKRGLAS